ncbi:hypothetical protein HYH03_006986 [Edaphochlamys debaryana]|uniref:Uncharacterized protein n=1 Tax=Edaphochlamys debaryana TaxID=47281 RepID=A0A836C0R3_9CHLO|nr:hypothetical protein HYH03_006986 [Edaphochlamys debaryana]|eukprot:KAG2494739.1 hypothetical protein HYH03_006986 [Edaphochlamys debaryana]
MPTMLETRVHAKCLRSVDEVRNYFRVYRAARRAEAAARQDRMEDGPGGGDDATDTDGGPSRGRKGGARAGSTQRGGVSKGGNARTGRAGCDQAGGAGRRQGSRARGDDGADDDDDWQPEQLRYSQPSARTAPTHRRQQSAGSGAVAGSSGFHQAQGQRHAAGSITVPASPMPHADGAVDGKEQRMGLDVNQLPYPGLDGPCSSVSTASLGALLMGEDQEDTAFGGNAGPGGPSQAVHGGAPKGLPAHPPLPVGRGPLPLPPQHAGVYDPAAYAYQQRQHMMMAAAAGPQGLPPHFHQQLPPGMQHMAGGGMPSAQLHAAAHGHAQGPTQPGSLQALFDDGLDMDTVIHAELTLLQPKTKLQQPAPLQGQHGSHQGPGGPCAWPPADLRPDAYPPLERGHSNTVTTTAMPHMPPPHLYPHGPAQHMMAHHPHGPTPHHGHHPHYAQQGYALPLDVGSWHTHLPHLHQQHQHQHAQQHPPPQQQQQAQMSHGVKSGGTSCEGVNVAPPASAWLQAKQEHQPNGPVGSLPQPGSAGDQLPPSALPSPDAPSCLSQMAPAPPQCRIEAGNPSQPSSLWMGEMAGDQDMQDAGGSQGANRTQDSMQPAHNTPVWGLTQQAQQQAHQQHSGSQGPPSCADASQQELHQQDLHRSSAGLGAQAAMPGGAELGGDTELRRRLEAAGSRAAHMVGRGNAQSQLPPLPPLPNFHMRPPQLAGPGPFHYRAASTGSGLTSASDASSCLAPSWPAPPPPQHPQSRPHSFSSSTCSSWPAAQPQSLPQQPVTLMDGTPSAAACQSENWSGAADHGANAAQPGTVQRPFDVTLLAQRLRLPQANLQPQGMAQHGLAPAGPGVGFSGSPFGRRHSQPGEDVFERMNQQQQQLQHMGSGPALGACGAPALEATRSVPVSVQEPPGAAPSAEAPPPAAALMAPPASRPTLVRTLSAPPGDTPRTAAAAAAAGQGPFDAPSMGMTPRHGGAGLNTPGIGLLGSPMGCWADSALAELEGDAVWLNGLLGVSATPT